MAAFTQEKMLEKRFDAYVSSMTRTRWFLLSNTLLAAVLACHMWVTSPMGFEVQLSRLLGYELDTRRHHVLDQFDKIVDFAQGDMTILSDADYAKTTRSKTSKQPIDTTSLKNASGPAIISATDFATALFDCKLTDLVLALRSADVPSIDRARFVQKLVKHNHFRDLAWLRFMKQRTDHTLADLKVNQWSLPLLHTAIHSMDFTPVVGLMLSVISAGLFLSARWVMTALSELNLENEPEMRRLAKLHSTFAGVIDGRDRIATACRAVAFFFPVFVLLLATMFDEYNAFGYFLTDILWGDSGFGGDELYQWIRLIVLVAMLVITASFCYLSYVAAQRVGHVLSGRRATS